MGASLAYSECVRRKFFPSEDPALSHWNQVAISGFCLEIFYFLLLEVLGR